MSNTSYHLLEHYSLDTPNQAHDLRAGLRRHFPIGYATRGSQRERGSWWPTAVVFVGLVVLWGVL